MTYAEMLTAADHSGLRNTVRSSLAIAAETIRAENSGTTNHANRLLWARAVLKDPEAFVVPMLKGAIANNSTLTLIQVTGASDSAVQASINLYIDLFAIGANP